MISVQFKEDKAIIKAGRSKFSLATLPARLFEFDGLETEVDFSIDQSTLPV